MNYHHIEILTNTPKNHSYFTGSMFRGALGYALKKVVCINPSYVCENCFAQENCLFYEFYEQKNVAHNYRFDIELGRDDYSFGLYLFADACKKLPYVLSAIHQMLTEQGLGRDKVKLSDFKITVDAKEVYDGKEFCRFDSIEQKSIDFLNRAEAFDEIEPKNILLKLKTPLRIKKNNRFLRDTVELEDIIRSINQRYTQLTTGESYAKLGYKPSSTTISTSLEYKTLIRNSNRQKSTMKMDGVMGEMVLANVDARSLELLKLGELIGAGKQTVFGLGKIEVDTF